MSKTSRIGIDARLWNETGVGRYIRNLVANLQVLDTQNEYVLFVRSKDKQQIQSSIINNKWSVVTADIRWHSIAEQLRFGHVLLDENLNLVHFPYFSIPILYTKPYIVTIHDLILHHFPTGKASTLPGPIYWVKQLAYRWIIAQAAKKAKKIITVSDATKKEIIEDLHAKNDKVFVTYEGVDSGFKTQEVRPKSEYANYFLYVGNAYPHKNLERLLEGFRLFRTVDVQTKLIFVGKEDFFYKRLKAQVAKLGMQEYVVFEHAVSDEKLADLYQHAKALVVPSLMEGFGLPGLEAMSNSCLVIASDIASLREIYADAAMYVDPNSAKSIAQVLEKVYGMKEKDRVVFTEKGIQQVKKFSWKNMAAQTLDVYESCIGV